MIIKVYPVSLKMKKSEKLVDELLNLCNNDTEHLVVFDVRRIPITQWNSAIYYFPEHLKEFLKEFDINVYIHYEQLGNYGKTDKAKVYLTDERKEIIRNLPVIRYNAFLCYCKEEDQKNNLCHASWICNYLNSLKIEML